MRTKKIFLCLFVALFLSLLAAIAEPIYFSYVADSLMGQRPFEDDSQPDPSMLVKIAGAIGGYARPLGWLLFTIATVWFWRNYSRSPQHNALVTSTAPALGGWLLPVAASLTLSLFLSPLVALQLIGAMISSHNETAQLVASLSAILKIGLIVYLFVVALHFLHKHSATPGLLIRLLLANLIVAVAMYLICRSVSMNSLANIYGMSMISSGIQAFVLIPYLKISKRVKTTFVNA